MQKLLVFYLGIKWSVFRKNLENFANKQPGIYLALNCQAKYEIEKLSARILTLVGCLRFTSVLLIASSVSNCVHTI